MRSLQPSKENFKYFKTSKHKTFFSVFLWGIFAFLDPDPAIQVNADLDRCGSGSETLIGKIAIYYHRRFEVPFNLIESAGIRLQHF
jgi:hypothetical protein